MVKSISIKGTEYSTLSNLASAFNLDNPRVAQRHFEAHGQDYTKFRISLNLTIGQRLSLGLHSTSKRTLLYEVEESSKWLSMPRPPKSAPRTREVEPRVIPSFQSRRFL